MDSSGSYIRWGSFKKCGGCYDIYYGWGPLESSIGPSTNSFLEASGLLTSTSVQADRMDDLLRWLPRKTSGFRRTKINLTCVDSGQELLALGSDVGTAYLYEREKKRLGELPAQGLFRRYRITCIKIYEPLNHLAFGTSSGLILVYKYCLNQGQKMQSFVREVHNKSVVAMTWHNAGNFLLTGDDAGQVFITSVNFKTNLCLSRLFHSAECPLVQLSSGAGPWALVSTTKKSFLISSETHLHKEPMSIGTKERRGGSFGACFFSQPKQAPVCFVARPGFRLWKTDMRGKVLCTLSYKELLSKGHVPSIQLASSITPSSSESEPLEDGSGRDINTDLQFGALHVLSNQYIVAYCESSLWILDPIKNTVLSHHSLLGHITALTATEAAIFVVREDDTAPVIAITLPEQEMSTKAISSGTPSEETNPPVEGISHGQQQEVEEIKEQEEEEEEEKDMEMEEQNGMAQGEDVHEIDDVDEEAEETPAVESASAQVPAPVLQVAPSSPVLPKIDSIEEKMIKRERFQSINQASYPENVVYQPVKKIQEKKKKKKKKRKKLNDQSQQDHPSSEKHEHSNNLQRPLSSANRLSGEETSNDEDKTDGHGLSSGATTPAVENSPREVSPFITGSDGESTSPQPFTSPAVEEHGQVGDTPAIAQQNVTNRDIHRHHRHHQQEQIEKEETKEGEFSLKPHASPSETRSTERQETLLEGNESKLLSPLPAPLPTLMAASIYDKYVGMEDSMAVNSSDEEDQQNDQSDLSISVKTSLGSLARTRNPSVSLDEGHVEADRLMDSWTSYSYPSRHHLHGLTLSKKFIYAIDTKGRVFVAPVGSGTKPAWKKLDGYVRQLSVSPSNNALMGVTRRNHLYSRMGVSVRKPSGSGWTKYDEDVVCVSIEDREAWAVRKDGTVVFGPVIPSSKMIKFRKVPNMTSAELCFVQVSACRGVIWAREKSGKVYCRSGVSDSCRDGTFWKLVNGDIAAQHMCVGGRETGWAVRDDGAVVFKLGVTPSDPAGKREWWEIGLSGYQVEDASFFNSLLSWVRPTDTSLKLVAADSEAGVCVLTGSSSVHLSSSGLLGTRYEEVNPLRVALPSSASKWAHVAVGSMDTTTKSRQVVWAVRQNGEIFCFPFPIDGHPVSVEPPPSSHKIQQIVSCGHSVWTVTQSHVFLREGINDYCPEGVKWKPADTNTMGASKIRRVSCGQTAVWAVDHVGRAWLRLGTGPGQQAHSSPAWIEVDGSGLKMGFPLQDVGVSADDKIAWAFDTRGNVYTRLEVRPGSLPSGNEWESVPGAQVKCVAVSSECVWAINVAGDLICRYGISKKNPAGDYWRKCCGNLVQISVTQRNQLWAIDKDGRMLVRRTEMYSGSNPIAFSDQDFEGWDVI